jgi:hypothetical protein
MAMTEANLKPINTDPGDFPTSIVLIRRLFLIIEAALATYFVISFRLEFGVVFIAYGVVCLFLLLPLIRCVRCGYYGKRCSVGWGKWVAGIFPRDDQRPPDAYYGYTMLFWPLRALPILLACKSILDGISGKFGLMPQGLFGLYFLILYLGRRFYRARACPLCLHRTNCPVYNSPPIS